MNSLFRYCPRWIASTIVWLGALALNSTANAQTYTWDGGAGNGAWNSATNWAGDNLPVSGSGTTIVLAGSVQTATMQNLGNPFSFNALTFSASAGSFLVSGDPLQFLADGLIQPKITLDADNFATVNSNIVLGSTTTLQGASSGTGGAGYDLILGGSVSGAGGLTVNFTNVTIGAVLNRKNNTYAGPTTITSGILGLGAVNAIGRMSDVTVNDTLYLDPSMSDRGVVAGVYDQRIGSLAGGEFGIVSLGTARLTTGFSDAGTTYSGVIFGDGGVSKVGLGDQIFTSSNLYTGSTRIEGGTITLAAVNGSIASTSISIAQPGALTLDNQANNNLDRLGDATTVQSRGGFITQLGNDTVASTETLGVLNLASGQSSVVVFPGASAGASLNFASLTAGTGTVVFFGGFNNLGNAPGPGVANVYFTAAPSQIGGIIPAGLGSGSLPEDTLTFVTYELNGIRPLLIAELAAGLLTATTTENVRETASPTVSSSITRNALSLSGDGLTLTVNAGQTLTLTSGALLVLPGVTGSTINGLGAIAFGTSGTSAAYVAVEGGNATVSTPFQSTGLIKSGFGTLTLQNTATLGAVVVSVNAGTLAVTGSAPLQNSPTIRLSGSSVDVTAVSGGFQLNSDQTLTGTGSVIGSVRVVGTIVPSAQPGPGTLNVESMTLLGGGRYDWQLNSAFGGSYTQSAILGTGSLDLTSPSLTPSNRFTIQLLSLAADNSAGAVSDFDNSSPYAWTVATFDGGISGFNPNHFTVDASQFGVLNDTAGGSFALTTQGNSLVMQFTPVPEPIGLMGLAAVALAARAWRRASAH